MPDKDEIMSICHIFANFGVIIHDNMEYRRLTEAEYNDLAGRIIYEDNHILVINKRAGEIVQGDKTGDEPLGETYKAFIAQRDGKPGKVFLGVPHRLDRPVSGLTILAKTSKALERLSAMFREGQVHKTYWALVCSRPDQDSALLEDWLVEVELLTGRHHQIRCQLAAHGAIIKGDLKYGAPRSNRDGSISLMARHVSFIHPVKKTPLHLTAPVPSGWNGVPDGPADPSAPCTTVPE